MKKILYTAFPSLIPKQKESKNYVVGKVMKKNIADMESNGVYFDDDVKEILKSKRDELYCEYSGLPSVMAYQN